jgi:acetyltransferase-like isoleucine patch superfamily enzyme
VNSDSTRFFNLANGHEPIIGAHCVIGWNSLIDCVGQVTIEDWVFFGHEVMVLTGGHDPELFEEARQKSHMPKPVTIKRGAWIGTRATVLPGVTIGEHAVVGAGSVVAKNVEAYTVVAGNPAKFLRHLRHP